MTRSFITIIILCLTLIGVTGLAAAGANTTANASFEGNGTVIENNAFRVASTENLSVDKYIYMGESTWDWKGHYANGEDGWISIVNPQIGKNSMRIVAVRSGYNGISMDLSQDPLNLSEKHFAVCVKSSNWSRLKEANLILASGNNFSDIYVFDIKEYFHGNLPANGEWVKVVMRPDRFKIIGNPDGTNVTHVLFQIKGEKCSDLYVDGFGYSQLLPAPSGKNVSNISKANVTQASTRHAAGQNVSNATANQSVTVPLRHHHHEDEEDKSRARIVRPSDKMNVQFNITSPPEAVLRDSDVTLSVASNLTSSEAKHLALQYEWNISREGASYSLIEGNNKTIGLPNGNYTTVVAIRDHFGRNETLKRAFAVENVSIPAPSVTPISGVVPVPSTAPNFTITPSPPAIESGGGTGKLWQWAIGLQLNTSDFSLSHFHIGSVSWLRGETFDASVWEAYKNGKEDLRRKYLLDLPSQRKIAYVITFIHGDGGKEISGDLISAG